MGQLQTQINEKISDLTKQRNEFNSLSEENAKLRNQANSQVAKIRAANATDHEAAVIAERDGLMVSSSLWLLPIADPSYRRNSSSVLPVKFNCEAMH
jgi:hypothetical protein